MEFGTRWAYVKVRKLLADDSNSVVVCTFRRIFGLRADFSIQSETSDNETGSIRHPAPTQFGKPPF